MLGLFGGSKNSGPTYQPAIAQNIKPSLGNLQVGEDLLRKKMMTDVTGLDVAGRAGVELNNQRLQQDLSQNQAANQGATDTAIAQAGLYGTDAGAVSRISQAGLNAGAMSNQGIFANASNQNLATTQSNLQSQVDQQNNAVNNSMQTFGVIPNVQNRADEINTKNRQDVMLANQQGQALSDEAKRAKKRGMFSAVGGALGMFGGPLGMAAGSALGGALAK